MQNANVQTLTLDEMTQIDAGAATFNYDFAMDVTANTSDADAMNGGYSLESMWSFEA